MNDAYSRLVHQNGDIYEMTEMIAQLMRAYKCEK